MTKFPLEYVKFLQKWVLPKSALELALQSYGVLAPRNSGYPYYRNQKYRPNFKPILTLSKICVNKSCVLDDH
jgi:hypothetical protein